MYDNEEEEMGEKDIKFANKIFILHLKIPLRKYKRAKKFFNNIKNESQRYKNRTQSQKFYHANEIHWKGECFKIRMTHLRTSE